MLRLPSPAKVNLSLRIMGKRPDGFHAIETRMCPISLADEVLISATEGDAARLTCSEPTVPTDESNLALKALRAFEHRTGLKCPWTIHLEKRIPHGAGLGGGSSNAATVLEAANQLSGGVLTLDQLLALGAELGSDVPFFLRHCTCDATGRGEVVTPVADFVWKLPLVLVKPPFGIPTPWAYRQWSASRELKNVPYAAQPCPWGDMVNDLERAVFEKWLMLPALKIWLLQQPETRAALMSGSGSTLFAVAHDSAAANVLADKARELCGSTTQVMTAVTL